MSHLDPELLALLALDEPVETDADRAHLASCPSCTADLSALRHAAVVGRAAVDGANLEVPHERVWDRIADELELGARHTAPDPEPGPGSAAEPTPAARPRRRRRTAWVLAACLAFVVAIAAGAWTVSRTLLPTEVAAASLIAFPEHQGAAGTAVAEESRDGTVRLTVTLDGDTDPDGYREVWLIRGDASALISLGVLEGDAGSFTVPAGIDLTEYSLVDISVEPLDGDPLHSGNSIVRGELAPA
ncbi:anti-sigma factor [Microbacterium sulfonylureivorans]|uniref:anti-sigma factor n=1 Tax=Microbacterium sulfonylureivorans TaxID=2486854 RepID=UPI000FD9B21E|nr:anti-sigma factor [Microbacterium sulfonylureivorans]